MSPGGQTQPPAVFNFPPAAMQGGTFVELAAPMDDVEYISNFFYLLYKGANMNGLGTDTLLIRRLLQRAILVEFIILVPLFFLRYIGIERDYA